MSKEKETEIELALDEDVEAGAEAEAEAVEIRVPAEFTGDGARRAPKVFQVPRELMEHMSDTKNSQGILAVVRQKTYTELPGDFFLILDTLQDPGNMGTIFRTAEAADRKTGSDPGTHRGSSPPEYRSSASPSAYSDRCSHRGSADGSSAPAADPLPSHLY